MMNKAIILSFSFILLFTLGCKKEDPQLGEPPTVEDANFTYKTSAESDNIIIFTATNTEVRALWDFGNGFTGEGIEATGTYPLKGTYTVTLTVFTRGGSISSSQDVVIAEDDLTLLSSPLFDILTGGSSGPGFKTWVIDSTRKGHMGVGPNPVGAAGYFPEWWEAGPNDKPGAGLYNDRYTFHLSGFKFDMETQGDVYVNTAQEPNFPGATLVLGDYKAPYDAQLGETWGITTEDDTTLTVSGNSFLGFYTGTNSYRVLHMEENEIFLRYLDAADPGLSWYLRLIPDGFDPGGGGGNPPDTTDTSGFALPIDLETVEPTFEAFGGSSVAVIDNPDKSGINTSNRVIETVHGNETWAGFFVDLKDKFDFTTDKNIAVKVWAPTTGTLRIKLEDKANSASFIEKDVSVTTANAWEEVSIDFSDATANTFNRLVLFPGWGVANAGTFYVDDIEQK